MSVPDPIHHKEYPDDYPPLIFAIVDGNEHCEYGGLCSVHISMAGKELLRYEAPTLAVAEEYLEHLEYYQPRLNNRKEWELVIFSDSGFMTLYLNSDKTPQCVMSHCRTGVPQPDTNTVYERVLQARTLAARYLRWHDRRYSTTTTKYMHKLESMLEVLNAVLMQPAEADIDKLMNVLCPEYHVQKGVKQFSKTRPQSPPVSTGKKGTANG